MGEALALAADLASALAGAATPAGDRASRGRGARASPPAPVARARAPATPARGAHQVVVVERDRGPIEPIESTRTLAGSAAQRRRAPREALRRLVPSRARARSAQRLPRGGRTAASLGCDHLVDPPARSRPRASRATPWIGFAEGPGAALLRGEALEAVREDPSSSAKQPRPDRRARREALLDGSPRERAAPARARAATRLRSSPGATPCAASSSGVGPRRAARHDRPPPGRVGHGEGAPREEDPRALGAPPRSRSC